MSRAARTLLLLALSALGLALGAPPAGATPSGYLAGAATVAVNPWYPVYMGGFGGGPAGGTLARHVDPLTGRPEQFTVRALVIAAGGRVIALERIDSQGYFAGYQEGPYGISDIRQAAARYLRGRGFRAATEADIIVSTLHEHASPTVQGIWADPQHALPYLKALHAAGVAALRRAARSLRPATLRWGAANVPWLDSTNIANANANEGWPNDGSLLALWARDARSGATIATYVSEPAYPNIVYGPGDLKCPAGVQAARLSTDFPSYAQELIESRLGGTALVASGTLGDQPGPMQVDGNPTADLPPVKVNGKRCAQTVGFVDAVHMGEILENLVSQALVHGHTMGRGMVDGREQYILTPVYNPLLLALNNVAPLNNGSPWTELGDPGAHPTDRSTQPPYEVGNLIGTWVTGLRIGDLLVLTEPGEFFPSTHQAWNRAIRGAKGVFVVGMGQDQLGYDFPLYAYPFTYYSADQNYFNPSLTLGDQVVTAGEQDARALGFHPDFTTTAEETALENQYGRVAQTGVQFIPFRVDGDLAAPGAAFSTVLEGFATPPRLNNNTPCNPPAAPNPPVCPTGPPPKIGPIHWSFGDGTHYVGGNGAAREGAYFHHEFCSPGRYEVSIQATDSNGHSDTFALPVFVHRALRVTILRRGRRLLAGVSGGGGVLYETWSIARRDVFTASIPVPPDGATVRLTVVDGTGTAAVAVATIRGGRPVGVRQVAVPDPLFAPGPDARGRCA